MSIEERFIQIYLLVCDYFPLVADHVERFSAAPPSPFSDEEVLAIYLFGIIEKRHTVKEIHRYICEHCSAWFPALPAYEGYNYRLGLLTALLPSFLELLERRLPWRGAMPGVALLDSTPIIMARGGRSDTAKVAKEIADKGYCASKKLYYHGLKLHAVVVKGEQCLPRLFACEYSHASEHDVQSIRRQIQHLSDCDVYADRAYFYHDLQEQCRQQSTVIWAIKPRIKGESILPADERLRNTSIARMRQPIESWFNWVQQKTGIENASKVRSTKGLIVHALGRLAAALIILIFNF